MGATCLVTNIATTNSYHVDVTFQWHRDSMRTMNGLGIHWPSWFNHTLEGRTLQLAFRLTTDMNRPIRETYAQPDRQVRETERLVLCTKSAFKRHRCLPASQIQREPSLSHYWQDLRCEKDVDHRSDLWYRLRAGSRDCFGPRDDQ